MDTTGSTQGRSAARALNGIVSAAMTVLLAVHGVWGAAALAFDAPPPPGWIAWAGLACVAAHVVLSGVTSWQQLTDTVRPPSVKKKRHLALKWATGALLAGVMAAHVARLSAGSAWLVAGMATLLAAAFAAHVCVGSKSLLKDLGVDRRWRPAVRAAACAVGAAIAVGAVAAALLA